MSAHDDARASGPDTPARRPADRKRQLTDGAAALFLERGYTAVSVADIARAAGVTAPSVYRHFTDKQALLAAAVLAGVEDLESCTDRAIAAAAELPEPDARRETLIESACAMAVRRPDAVVLWRWNGAFLSDEQNAEVARRTTTILDRWAQALRDGRAQLDHRSARRLALAMLSITGSLTVHKTRISTTRALTRLNDLVHRLIALDPACAPPLTAPVLTSPEPLTRRDEILDAASILFERKGFADVGVDEIGEAVGISGPSLYRHFSSKTAILLSIGARSAARLEAGAMAAHAVSGSAGELLSNLVDSYVGALTSTPDLSVAFTSASATAMRQDEARDLLTAQRQYVGRWSALVSQLDPTLPQPEAAVTVHAALSIANDAVRMRGARERPELPALLAYLMKGVLGCE
ncbi:TetR/AcrR family transcriptional regulator [Williamsia sp. CHRR-6]|uniref:TetR/AcrR family transcriptional regulator n=1 Tax=Williamsia sp. CHRR-6 TaxID=2835871 RepID=UPI001BD91D43|nr:TetR/AcrR family transcriptional regulator [Williamsia sp. CHRR-6]MBT0567516.1 TetR/AcrR family transcriptional regulator [Williamsia sp. CHRR-6]